MSTKTIYQILMLRLLDSMKLMSICLIGSISWMQKQLNRLRQLSLLNLKSIRKSRLTLMNCLRLLIECKRK